MPLFFVPPESITYPTVSITGPLLRHLRDSLRTTTGQHLLVGDGQCRRYLVEVTTVSKAAMQGRVLHTFERPPLGRPPLLLGQALLKGEKMDWVIQKATELGVSTIVPLMTRHAVVQPKRERVDAQTARWQRIALEAAQQSEQWSVPVVSAPERLSQFLAAAKGSRSFILTERREFGLTLRNVELPTTESERITMAVGPEGGWAGEEVAEAEQAGFQPVSLGPAILRAETAALVAVSIVQFRTGTLG